MKSLLQLVFLIAVWVITWKILAGYFYRRGCNRIVSHLAGIAVGFFLVAVVLLLLLPAKSPEMQEAAKQLPQASSLAQAPSEKSLNMTPEMFRQSFNRIILKIDADYKMAELDIQDGQVNNVFKRMLSENVGVAGTVSKNSGNLKELMIVMSGSNSMTQNINSVSVILASTQALNPSVPPKQNSKAVLAMVHNAMSEIKSGKSFEQSVGPLRYTTAASEETGLLFVVSTP